MQTDEEIGKVAAAVPVIISRALELFVESLVMKASLITKSRNAKTLTTSHLKSCVLADSNLEFLRELVSTIPDVQGEDEQVNPCSLDGNLSSGELREAPSHRRRPKDRGNSEDSAGPSHSTADESETWSAEEDGEEDSEESCTESTSHHPVVSSLPAASIPPLPCNVAFATSSSHHYLPHPLQCIPSSSTSNNVDDDYDS
ncbi:dr1-associated corepressor-like isoform X2 [Stegodyphus dumicola]|nr:dr1-associated corepressor-like isoform X2 [Stegodyphus dumicola]